MGLTVKKNSEKMLEIIFKMTYTPNFEMPSTLISSAKHNIGIWIPLRYGTKSN